MTPKGQASLLPYSVGDVVVSVNFNVQMVTPNEDLSAGDLTFLPY